MESTTAFIDRIKTDGALLSELSNLLEKEDAQSVAKFLRANGVSEEGVASLIHLDRDDVVSPSDELSDEELAEVSAAGFNWCNGIKGLIDSF